MKCYNRVRSNMTIFLSLCLKHEVIIFIYTPYALYGGNYSLLTT